MNIIILTEQDIAYNGIYKISDERFIHIKRILKRKVSDIIEIGFLNGPKGTAKITSFSDHEIILEIVQLNKIEYPKTNIDLICALPRPQTLKKVLNNCATMGINNLYLIRSEKVEKSYFHSPLLEEKNYSKFLIEGLSQGKRTDLPRVTIHHKFKNFFNTHYDEENMNEIRLVAHPGDNCFVNKYNISNYNNVCFAIGPEGGWNNFELDYMIERGFKKFKLSENILRVENAVTATLSQLELMMNQNN